MCRFFDNAFSGFNAHRISAEDYNEMQAADNRFNTLLAEIQEDVKIGAGFGPVMGRQDEVYDGVNDTIQADSRISLEENAKAATRLSYLTNDRIRYNSSGVEKRREKNEQAMRDELGDIAECGGSRQVTFRAGVDALFKLDIKIASLKARGGGSVAIGAKIAATNPDGSVSVTYSFGGQGHLEGSHKIGSDPDAKGDKASPGLGAELKGEVKIDGTYSVTKTYKNLDDFIKTASSLNLVMTPRPREAFYAWGKATLKGIGHMFTLGATALGFRIHRSRMDQVAYSRELRNRNVFGPMAGIFLRKRNVEIIGERRAFTLAGTLSGKAEAGVYFSDGEDGLTSNLEFGGELKVKHSRELWVKNKAYRSFVQTLTMCSEAYLKRQLEALFARLRNHDGNVKETADPFLLRMELLLKGAKPDSPESINGALSTLQKELAQLEGSAVGKEKGDKAFWTQFSQRVKVLATVTSVLTKRAEALDDALQGAALNTAANAGADLAKETLMLNNRTEVHITREKPIATDNTQPWMKSSEVTIDVRLTAAMPVRALVDLVVRSYVKSASGTDEKEASRLGQEIRDALVDTLKLTMEDVAIQSAEPLLDMTLGQFAEKSPAVKKLLGMVNDVKSGYDADYEFKDDTYKTLRFSFSNGRFSSFALSEDYDTKGELEFTPVPFIGINFSLSSETSIIDHEVHPKPTPNTLMKCAAEFASIGNEAGFAKFLARNKKGVLRLVEAGRAGAPARPNDKYWQADVVKMSAIINECRAHLATLAGRNGMAADQARQFTATFNAVADEMQNHAAGITDAEALDLAQRFFTAAATVYTMVAMA